MAIEVFPAAVTSTTDASSITATSSDTMYEGRISFDPAIYEITCASGTITNIQFFSGAGTLITSAVTVSGIVSINLATAADRVRIWTNTGSDVVVTVTKIASALTNQFSGTLDTITSTGNYTGTSTSGYGYFVLVGGGGGGRSMSGYGVSGGGGGSGGVGGKFVALTGSMSVTIGAQGNANAVSADTSGNAGGTSIFSEVTVNGGNGGGYNGMNGAVRGNGGTVSGADFFSNGAQGGPETSNVYTARETTKIMSFVKNGTTGGGGAGRGGAGAGSGIGTGGNGGNENNLGGSASGYGAGGGGAGAQGYSISALGGNGSPGVLYVLRF